MDSQELTAAAIVGNTVTLSWLAPQEGLPPTGYVIEGGLNPDEVLASIPTGSLAPVVTFVAPSGTFYVRVHALGGVSLHAERDRGERDWSQPAVQQRDAGVPRSL
jgi:hypothetical protein